MANKLIRHAISTTTDETTLIHALIKAAIAFQGGDDNVIKSSIQNVIRLSPSTHALDRMRRRLSQIIHGDETAGWGKGSDLDAIEHEQDQAA